MNFNNHKTKIERNTAILNALVESKSYQDIGDEFGVSRQRIQQIAKRAGISKKYVMPTIECPACNKVFRKKIKAKVEGNNKLEK